MKLSRLLPLALALLLSVLSARAEETGTMTIKTEDGKSIDIQMVDGMNGCRYYSSQDAIHERFVILAGIYRYDGSKLDLDTLSSRPGVINFEAPIINMTSITFSALDPAGVESIEKSPIQIDLAGGTISFSGVDSPISLIITFNTENQAPASMREIADRCYADLDEAAAIFKRIDFKRKHLIQPDLNVAKNANPLIDFDKMGYQSVQSAPSRNGAAGMKAPETRNGRHSETVREPESVLFTNPVVE